MMVKLFIAWAKDRTATALTETVVLFPVLFSLLMGCFDIGQGIAVNQKTIAASQMMADLIARQRSVDMNMLNDIIAAGELAMEPYSRTPMGYDIVSVQFDERGDPEVLWRLTHNTTQNDAAVDSTEGLGVAGEGIVVVTSSYNYRPSFAHFVVKQIDMKEVAFLRGRRSAVVACTNCP